MSLLYFYLILFVSVTYLVVTDPNFARSFAILLEQITLHIMRYKWLVLHHPKNPIKNYIIWRRSLKIAEQLQKEFAQK